MLLSDGEGFIGIGFEKLDVENLGAGVGRTVGIVDAVRDIDDMTYLGILADEMEWRVSMVCLAQSLCISYINLVGYFHGPKGRCPDEI